ncbi:MAG: V-type ATP synthase subunit E [Candidatus Micrarchaeota archaeon]|nr:V-type ATP synthase subunit E [Candidatus Micrarchaeota archaeon]
MSLQEIKEQIVKDARKRAGAIDEEAKTESYRITAEAKAKAKTILEMSRQEIAKRAEAMRMEHNAGVEIERNNLVLLAKGGVVDSSSGAVRKGIVSIVMQKHYDKIVKKAISSAKDLTSGAELVIKADRESQKILSKLGYKSVPSSDKGVIIQTKDGSIKIDASVESMLSNKDEMIRSMIAEALFTEKKAQHSKQSSTKPKKAKKVVKKAAKKVAKKKKARK